MRAVTSSRGSYDVGSDRSGDASVEQCPSAACVGRSRGRSPASSHGVRVVMYAASVERRRALARVLHEAPRVDPRFATLHVAIILYREQAAALFLRFVDLEAAGNENAAELRRTLVTCSEGVEGIATVVGAPCARGPASDWLEAPTIPRRRR
jgi:hypothetical protein